MINTVEKLEGLRYCKKITSGLTISLYDDNADFSSVFDIETIQGVLLNDDGVLMLTLRRSACDPRQQHDDADGVCAFDCSCKRQRYSDCGRQSILRCHLRYAVDGDAATIVIAADNPMLEDLGNVLDIQLDAANGTYVANNARLCMQPSIQWSRRTDSLIEHSLAQARLCKYQSHI